MFRRHLCDLLHRAGLEVVGEAGDIRTAQVLAGAVQPDLAVVDVMLPGISGIDGVPRLKHAAPRMHIVLVSAYQDQYQLYQASALSAGADAFISKDRLDLKTVDAWKALSKTREEK
jgi:DNA-binding NarL/FixJ family response regulator